MTDFILKQSEVSKWNYVLEHKELHEGNHFSASAIDQSMANGTIITMNFKTPNNDKYIHLLIEWASKAGGKVEAFEDATWTHAQSSSVNIIQNNRNADNISGLLDNAAQTGFNQGSVMGASFTALQSLANLTVKVYDDFVFGAVQKGGANRRQTEEIVLKKDAQYIVRYTAVGNTNAGFLRLVWYEHKIID